MNLVGGGTGTQISPLQLTYLQLHKVAWDFKILAQMPEILTAQIHVKFPLPVFPLSASAKSRKMAIHGREVQSSRQSFDNTLKSNSCFPIPDALGNLRPNPAATQLRKQRSHKINSWREDLTLFTHHP